jgi:adenylate cyclase
MTIPETIKKHGVRIGLSLAVLAICLLHAAGVVQLGFVQRMENLAYDARLNLMMPATRDDRIVILDIDEKSLREQGRWPWSRNRLAEMVNKLFDKYSVSVVGFDVVFAETDESSGLKTLEQIGRDYFKTDGEFGKVIERVRPQLDYDQVFAKSLKGRPVVLGYYFRHGKDEKNIGDLPAPAFVAGSFKGKDINFFEAGSFGANLPVLQANATGGGHFNPLPDSDGISRKISMLTSYNGSLYESLSLAVARVYLNQPKVEAGFATGAGVGKDYAGLEWLRLGKHRIPVDERVAALIPYRGRQGSFPYVSATDVLNEKADPGALYGAIVLVGTTAPGLMDLRASPVQSVYPGVEMHANMISGILDQNIKERPGYTLGAEVIMLLLSGLLLAFLLPVLSPLWATALTGAVLAASVGFNLAIWQTANLVLPIALLLLLITTIYVLNMSYGFFIESRNKRQLAGMFGQYIPPELVEEMVDKGADGFSLEGDSRELTVLFSDVRGFTTISEGLDPKQLTQLMNEYLTPMTHVIHSHRGTIDKYMGDAIMAFWGAPLPDPDNARHALQAAMDMIARLKLLQEEFVAKGWPPIKIGVGLNTGMMTVGNMGSEFRMAYTVMGDAVNLGSRLESITKQYGVDIIVSEFTKDKVPDFLFRELDRVRVKGKDLPVGIYEPVCVAGQEDEATRKELDLYRETLKLYRAQNWDKAEMQFINLQQLNPERYLYKVYLERIAYYREEPPGTDWDGVFTFKTK